MKDDELKDIIASTGGVELKRPETTQKVLDIIADVLDKQDEKGIMKYGETIDDAKDSHYDWNLMALEEMADGLKYLVRQNKRLQESKNMWFDIAKKQEIEISKLKGTRS